MSHQHTTPSVRIAQPDALPVEQGDADLPALVEKLLAAGLRSVLGNGLHVELNIRELHIAVRLGDGPAEEGVIASEPEGARMTPTATAILETLQKAEHPLKGESIARRANRPFSGGFRGTLAQLVKAGVLVVLPGGYWLKSREGGEA